MHGPIKWESYLPDWLNLLDAYLPYKLPSSLLYLNTSELADQHMSSLRNYLGPGFLLVPQHLMLLLSSRLCMLTCPPTWALSLLRPCLANACT